jgi:predicted TIM-barrel fold metal-dependent hydrolase
VFLPSNLVTSDFLPGRPKTTGENETEAKPAMIIDLHIHPYCREVSLKPGIEEAVCRMYGEKWDKAGLQRMTSQFKALFLERGVKDIIADMDASNIGRACIVALDLTTKYNVEMVDNDDVGKLASMHPDRFIPFASVDPSMGRAAVDKLARAVEEYGCKGLKLAPSLQGFDFSDSKHSPLWETALDLDIVVWSHTAHQAPFAGSDARLSHPMLLEPVAIRYPDLKIVLGHCGFPWARTHPKKVLWPNLFVRSKKPILKIFHIFLRLPFCFFLDLEPYSVFWDRTAWPMCWEKCSR